jgi:hypothetical protein
MVSSIYIIQESFITNDNTGTLVSVINSDTSSTEILNSKVVALVNLGSHSFSAYPLVLGVDVPHDALANLTDVSLVSPTPGQVLTYNGTKWTNQTPTAQSAILAKTPSTGVTPAVTTPTTILSITPSGTQFLQANIYGIGSPAAGTIDNVTLNWTDSLSSTAQTLLLASGVAVALNTSALLPPSYIIAASGTLVDVQATVATANTITFFSSFIGM